MAPMEGSPDRVKVSEPCDGVANGRPGPWPEEDRGRGGQGRPLVQERRQVRPALLDLGVPGLGPARRRRRLARRIRFRLVDPGDAGGPRRCRWTPEMQDKVAALVRAAVS